MTARKGNKGEKGEDRNPAIKEKEGGLLRSD